MLFIKELKPTLNKQYKSISQSISYFTLIAVKIVYFPFFSALFIFFHLRILAKAHGIAQAFGSSHRDQSSVAL